MNEDRRMTLEEFDRGLAAHGPDLARWPGGGPAAAVLLESSPPARRALAEAKLIAVAVAAARTEETPAPEALLERILADAADVAAAREAATKAAPARRRRGALDALRRWTFFPALRPAAICAASALVGLWLGQSAVVADTAAALTDNQEPTDIVALYGGTASEEQDIALAFQPGMEAW